MKKTILALAMFVASVGFAQEAAPEAKPQPVPAPRVDQVQAEKGKCGMGMKGKGMGKGKCMQARKGQDSVKPQAGCKDCKKEVKE